MLLGNSITRRSSFVYGGHTLYAVALTTTSTTTTNSRRRSGRTVRHVPQPSSCNPCRVSHRTSLASSAFARHYSRNHCCFLFLRVLRCFTSPRSLHTAYTFSSGYRDMTRGGFPHSEILGSQGGCHLPEAYRRLLRPSSAPRAQAFTVRPLQLRQHYKDTLLTKMLASTMQFSKNNPTPSPDQHQLKPSDREDQPHTPPSRRTVDAHAASKPNSVPPPRTPSTGEPTVPCASAVLGDPVARR